MRKAWYDSFPATFAFLVLFFGIIIEWLNIVPKEHGGRFEGLSNVTMLIIAIVGLLKFYLKQTDDVKKIFHILSNISVSISAFCMNIYVFQHTIRSEYFWEDIWGTHLFWLFFSVVQILLISGAGEGVLNVIYSLLREAKRAVKCLWEAVCELIKHADKYALCALLVSFISWSIYIGIQIYMNGKNFILEDTAVLSKSLRFWAGSLLICLLARIYPLVIQKIIEGVKVIEGRIMLSAVSVLILLGLTHTLSSSLSVKILFDLIFIVIVFILFFHIMKFFGLSIQFGNNHSQMVDAGESEGNEEQVIKYSDLIVVILVFVVPLVIILIWASLQPEAREIFVGNESLNIITLLEYIKKVMEIAGSFLK